MGREVRKVPESWEHPKDEKGHHIPLLDGNFSEELVEWEAEFQQWEKGFVRDWGNKDWKSRDDVESDTFEDWHGSKPKKQDYMPYWPEAERTHYQMYENTTEGTPISPVMKTPETLARWLADNNASSFADRGATYEQWLAMITGDGWAPSAIITPKTGLISGVEGLGDQE